MKENSTAKILIINGPNLNLVGRREPGIYGARSFEEYFEELRERYANVEIAYFQSNVEGELINALHEAMGAVDGVVLNAGGYTHTSVALRDAIAAVAPLRVVEVHISNILTREEFRHSSMIGPVCCGSIMGFGLDGYRLAVEALLARD